MRYILFFFLLLGSSVLCAQQRPKVGLALSGGGAKSMAQLGALRVIEQSGIKIDYISGTSMGAVIGAMYAMGYTVDEIEFYLSRVNWDELLSNDIPRDRLPYLNKNDEKYLLNIGIEDGKFLLPKAFNYGHYMLEVLSYLTMRYHDVNDFSKLPIPFLCMATNLENGESVVLESGNLTDALRASVAFPSIFSPYQIDSVLYVDGGVRNNLPIAVLKDEKNMDFVIAIDVQGRLYGNHELTGIVEVLEQVGSFQNVAFFEKQKHKANILVRPNIDEYDIDDYQFSDTIQNRGYRCMLPYLEQMQEVAKQQGNSAEVRVPGSATPLQSFMVDSILVTGVGEKEAQLALGKLDLKEPGIYNLEDLDRGLDLLYGSKIYDKANFQYKTLNNKKTACFELKEKSTRHSLRFGVHYDDDFSIGLLSNYTMIKAGLPNSILKADFVISENPRGQISWIIERGFVPALGVRASLNRFQPRLYANSEPISQFSFLTYNFDLFLQSTLSNNYTIGTGLKWDHLDLSEKITILGLEEQSNSYLIYHAFLDFDSFNRSFKPKSGFVLKAKFNAISNLSQEVVGSASSVLALQFVKAFKISKKVGMNAGLDGAATLGSNLDYPYNVFVGGLGQNYINFTFPFVGYRFMELIGRNYAALKVEAFYEVAKNQFISVKGNVGKLEPSFDELFSSSILLDGYGISYAYASPIGPLELTVMGSTNTAKVYTYISLGFWF